MTRGEIADRAGVNRETVRYYEQRSLIPKPPRSDGDYRIYTEDYVERIRFIKRAQELGFTLKEIKELLTLRADPERDCGEVKRRAEDKIADVREKIRDLEQIEKALSRLASACGGAGPTSACPILEAMKSETAFEEATH